MVLPLLAGVALRGIATRAAAGTAAEGLASSAAGRLGVQAAGQFGAASLQRRQQNHQRAQAMRQYNQQNPKQDLGLTAWARQNPGEAMAGGVYTGVKLLSSGSSLRDSAASTTSSILQSTQFH